MMILIHLLLLITSNVLAIDEEQKEIILGMIKELSRKAVQGEEIPADNPLSILPVKSMSTQRQTRKWTSSLDILSFTSLPMVGPFLKQVLKI